MSDNVSDNVELGHLPQQPQECCEDDHQEGDLDEDDEESKVEEKMSLLLEVDSLSCPPVQIVIADRHRSGPSLTSANPAHHPHITTPCQDIQLARTQPECGKDSVWAVTMQRGQLSSIHSVCGPHPVKLTTICLVVLSIWAMVVLIIHLDKKVSVMNSSLSYTEDKLSTMEDTASSYRLKTHQRLHKMQTKLREILHTLNTGIKSKVGEKKTAQPSPSTTTTQLPDATKQDNELKETEKEQEDGFFSAWPF